MRKTRQEKGITLIALIITIIVLLILAVVAIRAVQGDGIIQYARNARDDYQKAQENEEAQLQNYLDILDENSSDGAVAGPWTQSGTMLTNTKTGATLAVGDTVAYDETKGGTVTVPVNVDWKVLGAQNGQVLLMSTADVGEVELYGTADYYDNVGIGKINDACSAYAGGEGATGVRSIEVEDIDRITGFVKEDYGKDQVDGYGNKVTYTLGADGDTLTYTVEGKSELDGSVKLSDGPGGVFYKPDGSQLQAGESYTAEQNTYYYYQGKTYFPNTTSDPAYVMLFRNAANTSDVSYLLGSSCAWAYAGRAIFGVHCVVSANVTIFSLRSSNDGESGGAFGVRAVVSLDSDITFTSNGTNSWTIS